MATRYVSTDRLTMRDLGDDIRAAKNRLQCVAACLDGLSLAQSEDWKGARAVIEEILGCLQIIGLEADELGRFIRTSIHITGDVYALLADHCKAPTDIEETGFGPGEDDPAGQRSFTEQAFVTLVVNEALKAGRPIDRLLSEYGKLMDELKDKAAVA